MHCCLLPQCRACSHTPVCLPRALPSFVPLGNESRFTASAMASPSTSPYDIFDDIYIFLVFSLESLCSHQAKIRAPQATTFRWGFIVHLFFRALLLLWLRLSVALFGTDSCGLIEQPAAYLAHPLWIAVHIRLTMMAL